MRATIAGSRRKAAPILVRPHSSATYLYITSFTGRRARDGMLKEEPQFPVPSVPKKRQVDLSTDANSIGNMDQIDIDGNHPQAIGKRRRTGTSGPARVQFDAIELPEASNHAVRETRRSTRVAKGKGKQHAADLFSRLGQEFRAIAKTCEELGDTLE
jgi:hypothetical protein